MADIAGFSRLMGRDDEGTTARVLDFHERVRAIVESHSGRVVGTAGDSVFGDFDSVVEALGCAAEIQKDLHSANEGLGPDERIEARIGLHLGDVIVEEYNVFGDGVNIAARLEQLADPGGIVLSEAVYQQVKNRSEWPITEMGVKTLKNIEGPVRLYRIGPEAFGDERPPVPSEPSPAAAEIEERDLGKKLAKAEALRAVTDLIASSVREAKDAAGREISDRDITVTIGKRRKGIAAVLGPSTLVPLAIGALLVMARFSGWSETGWYPFAGAFFVGLGVGSALEGATGRKGIQLLMQAVGVAVGAWFLGGVVIKAIIWVISASMLGASIQALSRNREFAE